jgi:outer membrane protein OmpA-like peptidoglycan-associated protein
VLFTVFIFSGAAQEAKTFSLGILGEANANTRHGYGLAGGIFGDFGFTDSIAAGFKVDYGTDFYDVSSLEALAFGRYYFRNLLPFPLFVQAGAGLIILMEDDQKVFSVLGDGSVGIRFPMKNFYTEQYLRFGWPTGFGFGFVVGYRFGRSKAPAPVPEKVPEQEELLPGMEDNLYVPDIIFRANSADFVSREADPQRGLDQETIENNLQALATLAEFLKGHRDYTVLIQGFANPVTGTRAEEEQILRPLSLARAQFVRSELVKLGVEAVRLIPIGMGGSGANREDLRRNRSVRIVLQRADSTGDLYDQGR